MAQGGSAPVALALGGIAGILLISGIQGKSIAQVIQGDFGKAPNPSFPNAPGSTEPGGEGSQAAPPNTTIGTRGGGITGDATPEQVHVFEEKFGKPPAPGAVTPATKSPTMKREQELKHGIEQALQYKEHLEAEVRAGRLNPKTGTKLFESHFPFYAEWARELNELLK